MTMQQQNVNEVIDHIAAKLSVPVAHLWDVLTRQAQVEAWAAIAWAMFWTVLAATAFLGMGKLLAHCAKIEAAWEKRNAAAPPQPTNYYGERQRDPAPDTWAFVMGVRFSRVILAVIALAVALNFAADGVRWASNPEYYALRAVLSATGR